MRLRIYCIKLFNIYKFQSTSELLTSSTSNYPSIKHSSIKYHPLFHNFSLEMCVSSCTHHIKSNNPVHKSSFNFLYTKSFNTSENFQIPINREVLTNSLTTSNYPSIEHSKYSLYLSYPRTTSNPKIIHQFDASQHL